MNLSQVQGILQRRLKIGPLPSPADLKQLYQQGIYQLINVSGTACQQIYSQALLQHFNYHQNIGFRDIFSDYPKQHFAEAKHYMALSQAHERYAFLSAVQAALWQLRSGRAMYIFCHRGKGRSPTVSLAMICLYFELSPEAASPLIQKLRPEAKLSSLSFAAIRWLQQSPFPLRLQQAISPRTCDAPIRAFSQRLDKAAYRT